MGMFDLFRRLFHKKKPDSTHAASIHIEHDRPRSHHYTFAHLALRQLAYESPVECVGTLLSPQGTDLLCQVWESVDEYCKERGETSTIQPREFVIHPDRVGEYPCVVLEMPEPWHMTEAHYVALILKAVTQEELASPDLELLYFTLEKGSDLEGNPRTVFCAWNEAGSHLNFGDGPPPKLEAFIDHLEEHLSN